MKKTQVSIKQNKSRRNKKRPVESDAKALALIKASGILNSNAELDEILKLTEQLGIEASPGVQTRGHIFIFREVVFIECPD